MVSLPSFLSREALRERPSNGALSFFCKIFLFPFCFFLPFALLVKSMSRDSLEVSVSLVLCVAFFLLHLPSHQALLLLSSVVFCFVFLPKAPPTSRGELRCLCAGGLSLRLSLPHNLLSPVRASPKLYACSFLCLSPGLQELLTLVLCMRQFLLLACAVDLIEDSQARLLDDVCEQVLLKAPLGSPSTTTERTKKTCLFFLFLSSRSLQSSFLLSLSLSSLSACLLLRTSAALPYMYVYAYVYP